MSLAVSSYRILCHSLCTYCMSGVVTMDQTEREVSINPVLPRVIQAYMRQEGLHRFFLTNIKKVTAILRKYLLVQNVTEEGLQAPYRLDISAVPAEVLEQPEVKEAVEHIEFRENWVREVVDILNQLAGTVPLDRLDQLDE